MAKDVVFESERFEKRQNVKRILIPAAVIIVLIAAAVAVALIVRGGRGKPRTGGEDTAYPYIWTENKNGSVTLEIDRASAPGFVWAESGANNLLTVAAEQDETNGKTRFILTPLESGRAVLLLTLHREKDESDRIFELAVLAEVADTGKQLKMRLLSFGGKPLFGVVRGGEDTICPYFIRVDEDGDLMIAVQTAALLQELPETEEETESGNKEEGWQCFSDNETVAAVLGVITNEEMATAYLRPGTEPGKALVRMTDSISGTELTAEFELSEDGSLTILNHDILAGTAVADTTD